ncbi:Indoleamine 2,3-dioxygenase [Trichoderma velutinum]
MEAEGARIEHLLLQNMQAIQSQEYGAIIKFLEELITCIRKLEVILDRMYERCDHKIFFFSFQPFLAGSMNIAAAGLPNSIFYSQGNGRGVWLRLRGGSNAQSSLVQLLDILLGIEHASDGDHAEQAHSKAVLPRNGLPRRSPQIHARAPSVLLGACL